MLDPVTLSLAITAAARGIDLMAQLSGMLKADGMTEAEVAALVARVDEETTATRRRYDAAIAAARARAQE